MDAVEAAVLRTKLLARTPHVCDGTCVICDAILLAKELERVWASDEDAAKLRDICTKARGLLNLTQYPPLARIDAAMLVLREGTR